MLALTRLYLNKIVMWLPPRSVLLNHGLRRYGIPIPALPARNDNLWSLGASTYSGAQHQEPASVVAPVH
jgi:hypothetical protein